MICGAALAVREGDGTATVSSQLSQISVSRAVPVERQPPCPRATTILAGFQAAEVGVSFNVSG
jgi:hypothetical protein